MCLDSCPAGSETARFDIKLDHLLAIKRLEKTKLSPPDVEHIPEVFSTQSIGPTRSPSKQGVPCMINRASRTPVICGRSATSRIGGRAPSTNIYICRFCCNGLGLTMATNHLIRPLKGNLVHRLHPYRHAHRNAPTRRCF